MKTFHIASNGCPRRQLDATRVRNYFLANGYISDSNAKEADVNIIVSCGLFGRADWTYASAKTAQEYKGETLVLGCVPEMGREKLREHYKGKMLFSTLEGEGTVFLQAVGDGSGGQAQTVAAQFGEDAVQRLEELKLVLQDEHP